MRGEEPNVRPAMRVAECDDSGALTGALPEGATASDAAGGYACAVEEAARIVGQKWTLQIVNVLMDFRECRFCELQDALGGVNPSTLSTRLKMLEEQGIIERNQISSMPPHVVYRLSTMGNHLSGVIVELTQWSRTWLCNAENDAPSEPLEARLALAN
ncbi:MAG: winged helix-turn-helix transcriptional regulator [Caldilineaceae bacterium]